MKNKNRLLDCIQEFYHEKVQEDSDSVSIMLRGSFFTVEKLTFVISIGDYADC